MYKLLLSLRYLRTRYIALASIISVTLGVATMIVVNSVMAGFSSEMRERIHGLLADVIIETASLDGVPDADAQMAKVRRAAGDYIAGMTTTVEVYGMLSFQYHGQWVTRPITLIGIKPEEKASVGPLIDYLDSYNVVRERDPRTGRLAVVRRPLRFPDETPGWELTDEAARRRREWKDRERRRLQLEQGREADGAQDHQHGKEEPGFHNPFEGLREPVFETDPGRADGRAAAAGAESAPAPAPSAPEFAEPGDARDGDSPRFAEPPVFSDAPEFAGPPPFRDAPAAPQKQEGAKGDPIDERPPFDLAPHAPERPSDVKIDPYAPLEGRVYIGAGLVSFPYEDPETGQVRTMMMVQPGDDVKISTVNSGRPPEAVHFNATVTDIFKSGMSEYDSNLVFCNLEHLQKVRAMIDPQTGVRNITSIQIKLKDFGDADEVVKRLKAAFPPGLFSVRTWEQKQGPLLAAVEVESAILNVLLFLIIAVAGFGILAIFFMIVVEKTKDIGILKALGASSRGVMSIFLSYGLALGIVGSGAGVILGLLFVRYINTIEGWITYLTGRKVFDEKIYYFPEIPTSVSAWMVLWVAAGAMTIAVLASVLPARRASRLHPVEALRYE